MADEPTTPEAENVEPTTEPGEPTVEETSTTEPVDEEAGYESQAMVEQPEAEETGDESADGEDGEGGEEDEEFNMMAEKAVRDQHGITKDSPMWDELVKDAKKQISNSIEQNKDR